jgi:hypothetical protein
MHPYHFRKLSKRDVLSKLLVQDLSCVFQPT